MKRNVPVIGLITAAVLYAMLAAVFVIFCVIFHLDILHGLFAALVLFAIQIIISLFVIDDVMTSLYRISFDQPLPDYLKQYIDEIAEPKGVKKLKIGIVEDINPAAFTFGRSSRHSTIVFSRGLFSILTAEELKAVAAREVSQAESFSTRVMSVFWLLPAVFFKQGRKVLSRTKHTDKKNWLAPFGGILIGLYHVFSFPVLWFSRERVYSADRYACVTTSEASNLTNAIIKICFALSTSKEESVANMGFASMPNAFGIFDSRQSKALIAGAYRDGQISKENIKESMKWELWSPWATINEIVSTHPLLSKRLVALGDVAGELGQEPFIEFNEEKPQTNKKEFIIELLLMYCPWIVLIVGVVLAFVKIQNFLFFLGLFGVIAMAMFLYQFAHTHPTKKFDETTIKDLLGKSDVSGVVSFPCMLKGLIIGRGDEGCVFGDEYVLKDPTGMIFLDYKVMTFIWKRDFSLFRKKKVIDRNITVKGWYRRDPVPYVEIHKYEVDKRRRLGATYMIGFAIRWAIFIAFAAVLAFAIIRMKMG